MAITKVTSGLISADASSIDLNIDAGTLYLDVSENRVGIGTTSPAVTLDVTGNGRFDSVSGNALRLDRVTSGNNIDIDFYNPIGTAGVISRIRTDGDGLSNLFGAISFHTGTTPDSPTEAMRINRLGNVGIGTDNPTNFGSGFKTLQVTSANTTSGGVFRATNSDSSIVTQLNTNETGGFVGTTTSHPLVLGTANAEKMRIHSSGCVGVGSTVDRSLGTNIGTLVVNGSAGGGLWLSTGDSSSTTSKIYSTTNGSVGELIINQGSGVGGGNILFTHNESATPTMTLQSNKNVLIGDITSDVLTYGKLQVAGGGYTAGFGGIVGFFDTDGSVASSNIIMKVQFIGDSDATGGVFIRFSDSDSTLGQITAANGTQVSYGVSSDERLKENIVDASSQLDLINNIRVREFDWKVNGYHEVGMIAQELNTVVPSVVQEGGDDITEQPWTVDYGKLTPYLIKAIQEQQTIIDNLTTRIETLENA